jgi:hypothetical protein
MTVMPLMTVIPLMQMMSIMMALILWMSLIPYVLDHGTVISFISVKSIAELVTDVASPRYCYKSMIAFRL